VVVARPLKELELADKPRIQPLAFRRLRLGQALTPPAASRFREVGERTFADQRRGLPPASGIINAPASAISSISVDDSWRNVYAGDSKCAHQVPPPLAVLSLVHG
jgi:hypothetical protein